MEESKAAAYYDELTRKGEGAARFKQGLGYSSTTTNKDSSAFPTRGSALSSSLQSSFVRASSPSNTSEFEKQAQLETIQNKLKKKPTPNTSERSEERSSRVSRDSHRDKDRISRRRSRDRDRDRGRDRDRDRDRNRDRDRDRRSRRRSRSRSVSDDERKRRRDKIGKERNGEIDFAKLIDGYDKMSAAERVKAKMKLQLSETAKKDATKGSGWERFEFEKDAPLDDEEIEAVEDDVALVKHIGQSFRYSAVETRREEQIKSAHDEAMFGASSIPRSVTTEDDIEQENINIESNEKSAPATSLLSDTVIAKQQGSWRDRARKV